MPQETHLVQDLLSCQIPVFGPHGFSSSRVEYRGQLSRNASRTGFAAGGQGFWLPAAMASQQTGHDAYGRRRNGR